MSCCDDPTEPLKVDPRDLRREQEHYGNLLRDLFTGDPERVILKQLREANAYLRELAALRAHFDSVRLQAIKLLEAGSIPVLERIIEQDSDGTYVASVPSLRGCHTQGSTLDQIMERIREVIALCIEEQDGDIENLDFVGIQQISLSS